MAYVSTDLALGSRATQRASSSGLLASMIEGVADSFRRRRIYRKTLLDLQGYSERDLADIGADQGIEEFARRAAGF